MNVEDEKKETKVAILHWNQEEPRADPIPM